MRSTDASPTGRACAVPTETATFDSLRVRRRASAARSGCGSTPMTEAADVAQRGRWKPLPQPTSRKRRPRQDATVAIATSIRPCGSAARFSISYVAGWCQMFGDGVAPVIRSGPGRGGLELSGQDAWGAVGGDPLDLDVLERCLDGLAEPFADALGVAGDLQ